MMHLIIHMSHASLIPCISLEQYLNPNLYTIPNMQNMRFFCCSVYIAYQILITTILITIKEEGYLTISKIFSKIASNFKHGQNREMN